MAYGSIDQLVIMGAPTHDCLCNHTSGRVELLHIGSLCNNIKVGFWMLIQNIDTMLEQEESNFVVNSVEYLCARSVHIFNGQKQYSVATN